MKPSPGFFRFRDSLQTVVTVVAIRTDHRISTYRLPVLAELSNQPRHQSRPDRGAAAAPERRRSRAEPENDGSKLEGRKVSVWSFHLSKTRVTSHLCVYSRGGVAAPAEA